jgi:hypothetical protein
MFKLNFFKPKKTENIQIQSEINLVSELHYNTDWWQRKFALEYFDRFNEDLYSDYLIAKLNSVDKIKQSKGG